MWEASGERPVLYADSEGQAGLAGRNPTAAIQLIVRALYWRDCLGSASGGLDAMRSAVPNLEREYRSDNIDLDACRVSPARLLSLLLPLPPTADVLA
ncbi:hypothetical protein AB0M44_44235 [Streptosporangium subroseum]|uniref:hypothetical protein n=1 Tax=Streptosporangium subroseum TaxID=106412 RepID=UPI0034315443